MSVMKTHRGTSRAAATAVAAIVMVVVPYPAFSQVAVPQLSDATYVTQACAFLLCGSDSIEVDNIGRHVPPAEEMLNDIQGNLTADARATTTAGATIRQFLIEAQVSGIEDGFSYYMYAGGGVAAHWGLRVVANGIGANHVVPVNWTFQGSLRPAFNFGSDVENGSIGAIAAVSFGFDGSEQHANLFCVSAGCIGRPGSFMFQANFAIDLDQFGFRNLVVGQVIDLGLVTMSASAQGYVGKTGDDGFTFAMTSKIDPIVEIDPSYPDQDKFEVVFSPNLVDGVGAVPEPSTWALLGAGLLALSAVSRRRASRA